ncbi:MAG: leucine-rich repeat domain-containing protein [Sphingobacteriales bacterium]|nr:MAG: leucine-rich repeat domain-containing protein [Sphingobacteriales bacterium]
MSYPEAQKRIETAKLEKAESLNLSNCGLTQIPQEVFLLSHLKELKLGYWSDYTQTNRNRITHLPAEIQNLENLRLLDLSCNLIEELPEEILTLKNLVTLDLSRNALKFLPEHIGKLNRLQSLDLGFNQLTTLPASFSLLNQLVRLGLNNNQITVLPEVFTGFKKLQRLDLSNNQLYDLSAGIVWLETLQHLSVSSNHLRKLPSEIGNLVKLQRLHLNNNLLTNLPDEFVRLASLQRLYLGSNAIEYLPDEIHLLQKLQLLDLNNNCISFLPDSIHQLINLEYVDLRDNVIVELPDKLDKLKSLQLLDIRNNHIRQLPESVAWLPNLQYLYLNDNPIETPPPEIAHRGLPAIRHYFTELNKALEKDYLYEIKLLLVGEGRVGKTTLSKALTNPSFALEDEVSTEGIDIKEWIIPKEQLGLKKDFRVNIWDFGGQEIYHSTHQFFLTKRSVYILVTESRKEDKHEDFYYWLNIIQILGGKSPVILALNKCDQPIKELPIKEYQKTFKNIAAFSKISCHPDYISTIQELKTTLKNILTNRELLPHLGTPLPKVWIDIRAELEALKNENKDFISYKEYITICRKHYIDQEGAMYLSDFFHDLGIILHFQDDPDLKNMIFLNHDWVTSGVYKVFDNQRVKNKRGHFTNEDLENIWNEEIYAGQRKQLLALMKNPKFELCFELQTGQYLAPQLLPVDEPEHDWHPPSFLMYEYRYHFMPKGILPRLIVKLHYFISKTVNWRYGVLIHYNQTMALVKENYFERKISICITGSNYKEILELVRNSLDDINGNFSNLQIREMLACQCNECLNQVNPHFFPVQLLYKYAENGKDFIVCERSLDNVNIYLLLQTAFKGIDHPSESELTGNNPDTMINESESQPSVPEVPLKRTMLNKEEVETTPANKPAFIKIIIPVILILMLFVGSIGALVFYEILLWWTLPIALLTAFILFLIFMMVLNERRSKSDF